MITLTLQATISTTSKAANPGPGFLSHNPHLQTPTPHNPCQKREVVTDPHLQNTPFISLKYILTLSPLLSSYCHYLFLGPQSNIWTSAKHPGLYISTQLPEITLCKTNKAVSFYLTITMNSHILSTTDLLNQNLRGSDSGRCSPNTFVHSSNESVWDPWAYRVKSNPFALRITPYMCPTRTSLATSLRHSQAPTKPGVSSTCATHLTLHHDSACA